MKKILFTISVASMFLACKSKSDMETNKDLVPLTDSFNNSNMMSDTSKMAQPNVLPVGNTVAAPRTPVRKVSNSKTTNQTTNTSSPSPNAGTGNNNNPTATAPTTAKKGWSKAAKGATIGAVGGAAAGAIIGKNAKGAVIGGVVGAAGGYIIGRSKDKKDGRVQ